MKNAPRMDISEISAAVKGVSEYKVDIQDYLDIFAVWYRDVLYFKATRMRTVSFSGISSLPFRSRPTTAATREWRTFWKL